MDRIDSFFLGFYSAIIGLWVLVVLAPGPPLGPLAVEEAVKQGHAEYYLDDKHERQWRWKEIK